MFLLALFLACAALLAIAYRTYGSFIFRWLGTDARKTPACELDDGLDYVPASPGIVTGQHFTAIAAAGPIVGPILAGLAFGWLPALLWILIGSVFVGGVHDIASLFASLRHKASSIVQVVRQRMSPAAYHVFLLFVWMSLVYVIIAFTDLTASAFARVVTFDMPGAVEGAPQSITVLGGGVATAAVAYLVVSVVVGLLTRHAKLSVGLGATFGVVSVAAAIWFGQQYPLTLSLGEGNRAWNLILLGYCFLASVLPMWLLLQPRGLLGAIFLYAVLAAGVGGVFLGAFSGGNTVHLPAFKGWEAGIGPMVPFLFITIACGACSGFHSIVATGTTSRQVREERHVKPIAYGAMLLEAMVAVIALSTAMMLLPGSKAVTPDAVFAQGIGRFLQEFGVPLTFAVTFGLLAFSTFIFDTLDVCTRLGRYVMQELFGWRKSWAGAAATAVTLVFPAVYLWYAPANAWRQFWTLFGTSNQLLAALTLVGLSVWFRSRGKNPWPVLAPAIFMLCVTGYALAWNLRAFIAQLEKGGTTAMMNLCVAAVLAALGLFVSFEAFRAMARKPDPVEAA